MISPFPPHFFAFDFGNKSEPFEELRLGFHFERLLQASAKNIHDPSRIYRVDKVVA